MKPYLQTTEYTTAASSLLTILSHFNKLKPTKENELKIWKYSVDLPTRGSSIYALANLAQELNPIIIAESTEYEFPDYRFYRYTKEDIEIAKLSSEINKSKCKVPIKEKKITLNTIKQLLKNNILLIRLNTKPIRNEQRNTSNYLVLYKYDTHFHIVDPKQGKTVIDEITFKEALKTLKTKKYRSHKLIAFPNNI